MPTPFPGMDPYLERPAPWPDVHSALVAAIRDALSPVERLVVRPSCVPKNISIYVN